MLRSVVLRAFAATALAALAPAAATAADRPVVTVFAAASLREAFEAAAPADVFAAANATQMTRVAALVGAKDPAYGRDFGERVAANVVSEETDVKAVATKVALGDADVGVVYATDVTPALAPKVRVFQFSPGAAPEAAYPIAAVKNAANGGGARAFVEFITSPAGWAFLKARGFEG
ncbi:MAG TPA: extracellular solute-binding protein [Candidatus Elarobacter sp.]|jgi:molybdate transport system substrate-binding protein